MSNYIGNQPSAGEFKKLDSIASSFNGSLTQFDLDYSTVNQSVGDATQLIVSLNGIIQEPGSAYTLGIGGGSIVFASAPASTDTCHIVLLGGVGDTTTPTDGSVTASKLDASLKDYLEETFTANGSQTVFTLTRAVVGANTLLVTIDGIVQPSSAFTASGTTLTISEVLAANTNVRVVHMGVKGGVYVPANDSITADMLANSINTDIASKLPLAGGTLTGNLGVTGTVTSDGLTVEGSSVTATIHASTTNSGLALTNGSTNTQVRDWDIRSNNAALGDFVVRRENSYGSGVNTKVVSMSSGGNISFYEDTGTSAKFFWDASAENIQLSGNDLDISAGTGNAQIKVITGSGDAGIELNAGNTQPWYIYNQTNDFRIRSDDTDYLSIATNGNTIIGGQLQVDGNVSLGVSDGFAYLSNVGTGNAGIYVRGIGANNTLRSHSTGDFRWEITGSQKMMLDASGNVGIGVTPETWDTSYRALQFAGNGALSGWGTQTTGAAVFLSQNAYKGSTWKYISGTDEASLYEKVNGAHTFYTASSGSADSTISWNTKLKIDSDGLKFNGDTAAANALDDYEEGDWTPTPNSGSFSASGGKYTKIGRVVTLNFDITVGSGGGSQITLPFSAATTTSNAIYTSSQNFATGRTAFYGVAAGANMYFRVTGDNVTYIAQTFDVGATIHASITYHTT
jgi:hypothetical protein